MNQRLLMLFAFVLFMSPLTHAQDSEIRAQTPATSKIDAGFASKGTRVTFSKPFLSYQMVQSINGQKKTTNETASGAIGVGVGYVYLPVHRIGWAADFSGLSYAGDLENQYSLRLSASLATALTSRFYTKAGLNVSDLTGERTLNGVSTSTTPGLGAQVGLGYQIDRRFGLELAYVWMNQNNDAGGVLFQEGVEAGLSGTF